MYQYLPHLLTVSLLSAIYYNIHSSLQAKIKKTKYFMHDGTSLTLTFCTRSSLTIFKSFISLSSYICKLIKLMKNTII